MWIKWETVVKIELELPATDEERALRAKEAKAFARVIAFADDYFKLCETHGLHIEVSEWSWLAENVKDDDYMKHLSWEIQ